MGPGHGRSRADVNFHSNSNVFLVEIAILDKSTDNRWNLQDGHGQSRNCDRLGDGEMRLWFKPGTDQARNMGFRIPAKADLLSHISYIAIFDVGAVESWI